jgi:serralysin
MSNESQWCYAWFALPLAAGQLRAALLNQYRWQSGDIISVSFLDGDPRLHERVKKAALQWTAPGLANLTFDFRKNNHQTDVRISFAYAGSWSVLGTTCRELHATTQATMNFGWLNLDSPEDEVNRVVLHEFGHALGLIHEHQNPAGGIPWNREQVIADLSGPPNHWSLEEIEFNMFTPFQQRETNFTETDATSIMMYPIPAKWTRSGYSAGLNSALSTRDRTFIHAQYP